MINLIFQNLIKLPTLTVSRICSLFSRHNYVPCMNVSETTAERVIVLDKEWFKFRNSARFIKIHTSMKGFATGQNLELVENGTGLLVCLHLYL